ncbi:hypothetical protein BKA24_001787 [Microbacterium marinum]|uniref:AAA domain-containing protein n=1 Tax=Microbacterium marinum TaxID=421115 RepID=A0A7W7BQQ4_9MICO|nr:AAA family ATPase [Microbacterium marinum]MBB4667078.1 hypothetical protein [Microbacterium marinum]
MSSATPAAPAAPVTQLPMPIWAQDIAPIEDFGEPGSIMIHAEPGQGKSRAALTIAKVRGFDRGVVLDIDNGTEVLLNDPVLRAKHKAGLITIIRIDKTQPDAFVKFHNYFNDLMKNGKAYGFQYLIVDTLDVAQETAIEWFLANTWNDDHTKLNTQGGWGEVAKWTSNVLWQLQNHPDMLGIGLVHTKVDEKEAKKTGVSTLKPKFQGSMKDNAAGIPSVVVYLRKEELENGEVNIIADLSGTDGAISKQRYSSFLPNRIDNFSMDLLYGLIRGEVASPVAATQIPTMPAEQIAAAVQPQAPTDPQPVTTTATAPAAAA